MISLIISTDYIHTTVALFKENRSIARIQEENKNTSKFLIYHIDTLCTQYQVSMTDIAFIGINQGPGPFTTLRVTLATVNGIAFASRIPLVGVDSIKTLIAEHFDHQWPYTVALLNAFNDEVYYAIEAPHHELRIGYKKIDVLLAELKDEFPEIRLRLIGAGVITFKEHILRILGDQAHIPDPLPLTASLEQIAKIALAQYNAQETTHKLLPLYLKAMNYKPSITIQ